jgi:hypothetical protein
MNHRQTSTGWLAQGFCYPLVAVGLLAMALLATSDFTMKEWPDPTPYFNLGLAWIPYLCGMLLMFLEQGVSHWRLPQSTIEQEESIHE